jgi:Fe-S oxidoreductase
LVATLVSPKDFELLVKGGKAQRLPAVVKNQTADVFSVEMRESPCLSNTGIEITFQAASRCHACQPCNEHSDSLFRDIANVTKHFLNPSQYG